MKIAIHRFIDSVAIHNDQGKRHADEHARECGVNGRLRYTFHGHGCGADRLADDCSHSRQAVDGCRR